MNMFDSNVKSTQRESIHDSYNAAKSKNKLLYQKGDVKATEEYIYKNQKEDAFKIVDHFYSTECRVVSIQKKTKVGADGLMVEIVKLLTTHSDDDFIVNLDNVRIITGMSNISWERI